MSNVHDGAGLTYGWPADLTPRLLKVTNGRELLAAYQADGGYRPVSDAHQLLHDIEAAGLRGRGGAAFPMARKLHAVRDGDAVAVVVANGEEGEPASVKDRWLLINRPHLVLDGVRLAAAVTGADLGYVYVSDPAAEQSVRAALDELALVDWFGLEVRVVAVAPGYIAGEESAVVRAINGGPAKPTEKPPRPFEQGVAGRPTLVSNVETLANLPFIQAAGPQEFRALGTEHSPGTFLLTVTRTGRQPGLYEMPLGQSLHVLLEACNQPAEDVRGALLGGYFAGLINTRILQTSIDYDSLIAIGTGLGCGAITLLGPQDCPVAAAAAVMAYFDRENAGQCGSCFNGTAAMSAVLGALRDHVAQVSDVERLAGWSVSLRSRGACATLDGATNIAASLLHEFPDVVTAHLEGECGVCRNAPPLPARPFAVHYQPTVPIVSEATSR